MHAHIDFHCERRVHVHVYVCALLISGTPTTVTGESIFVPFLLQIMAESKWYHGDREAICYSETFGVQKMAAKKIKCIATDCLKNKASI